MTLAKSGGHMLRSVVGSSPFRGENKGPRRPPVRRDRSSDSLITFRRVKQP